MLCHDMYMYYRDGLLSLGGARTHHDKECMDGKKDEETKEDTYDNKDNEIEQQQGSFDDHSPPCVRGNPSQTVVGDVIPPICIPLQRSV